MVRCWRDLRASVLFRPRFCTRPRVFPGYAPVTRKRCAAHTCAAQLDQVPTRARYQNCASVANIATIFKLAIVGLIAKSRHSREVCMSSLSLVTLFPCLGIALSALLLRQRIRVWIPFVIASVSVLAGAIYLRAGVLESCRIAESECLGATATAWIVAIIWALFGIAFLVCLASAIRRPQ